MMSDLPSLQPSTEIQWDFGLPYPSPTSFEDKVTSLVSCSTVPIEPQTKLEGFVRTINAELMTMGYPSVLLVEAGVQRINVDSLAQNMVHLLKSYSKMMSLREDLESRLQRVESDLAQLRKMYNRCQDNLSEAQKANAFAKERERRSDEEKKSLNAKLKANADELRKMQANFQRYETQLSHERRKSERETVALRERLLSSIAKQPGSTSPKRRSPTTSSSNCLSCSMVSLNSLCRNSDRSRLVNSRAPKVPASARVAGKSSKTPSLSALSAKRISPGKSDKPWTIQDTATTAVDGGTSQADMYALVIQQLHDRQHSLLYENRELRDLVSQLSSRMVRFTRFATRQCTRQVSLGQQSPPPDLNDSDAGFDSLDEDDEECGTILRPESSDEDVLPHGENNWDANGLRRGSAHINQLLLEVPYALVRDHLTRRVRQLSRELWRSIKQLRMSADDKTPPNQNLVAGDSHCDADTKSDAVPLRLENGGSSRPHSPRADKRARLESEVAALKKLVSTYEDRLREQDMALRYALFSSARRCGSLSHSGSPTHKQQDRVYTPYKGRSGNTSPNRRRYGFNLGSASAMIERLKHSSAELDNSSPERNHRPMNGGGDTVSQSSGSSPSGPASDTDGEHSSRSFADKPGIEVNICSTAQSQSGPQSPGPNSASPSGNSNILSDVVA
ncbi:unnamed protein product [Calicophoron daubneyi]|uniref:Uncharacterized protein n=1 Tax=Calicophoron daubneyi TaxID=300641 RepID=A0AAV2TDB2_CALDB